MKRNFWMVPSIAAFALLWAAAAVQAGWVEQGDAGPFYQGGQIQQTIGNGDLDTIAGTTVIPGGVVPGQTLFRELVDVYSIRVTDPAAFYATTDASIDARASSDGDARIFLLDPTTGNVILLNDDTSDAGLQSLIGEPATFLGLTTNTVVHATAQNVDLVAGQLYHLAVTEFGITALDQTGILGNFQTGPPLAADRAYPGPPTDPLNTNGGVVGGNRALVGAIRPATVDSDWGSNIQLVPGAMVEDGISYTVALRGATYATIPEPGTIAIALLAILSGAIVAVRRKLG